MRSIADLPIDGCPIFVRVDFNVPIRDGRVADATRIRAAIPTIEHAVRRGARVILASHLGRPKGQVRPECSLGPVAGELSRILGRPVPLLPDCIGEAVQSAVAAMNDGDVLLLENLRFHPEEEANDDAFAAALAAPCAAYVNDAFGTAHRAHASTVGIVRHVAHAGAGFLLCAEVKALSRLLTEPRRPFAAVVGGAKVSDKIRLMRHLLDKVDAILVGGAMAYTFLTARGIDVGASRVEDDHVATASGLMEEAANRGVRIVLPCDHVVVVDFSELAPTETTAGQAMEPGRIGVDIGPQTRDLYREILLGAGTIFWNGPMGVFEWASCAPGTMAVARAVADSTADSVVGGGDSVAALGQSGRAADITHISTGGGASLEFLEGRTLPGVEILEEKARQVA